jgi:GT2 family glycosyltransferase
MSLAATEGSFALPTQSSLRQEDLEVPQQQDRMRVAVGIATIGRPETLSETLLEIARQTRLPDLLILCPVQASDIDFAVLPELPYRTKVVSGGIGSAHQRNAILRETRGFDAIVFFDDDYFPEPHYLANAERLLLDGPDIGVINGTLIEDGINGPGLAPEYARQLIEITPTPVSNAFRTDYGAYGCNMVVRLEAVHEHGVTFDEVLPLYAWQEDIDFSRQLAAWGSVVRSQGLLGVHLGVKRGRTSGVKLGYSQVANPIYLMRKGTVSISFGGRTMVRNLLANLVHSLRPESYIDRVGRMKGNMFALIDLVRGRLHPGRIFELE